MPSRFSHISRYFISVNIAALITFGLFYSMQRLISNGQLPVAETQVRTVIDFGKVRDKHIFEKDIDKPMKQDIVENPPSVIVDNTISGRENIFSEPIFEELTPIPPAVKPGKGIFITEGDFISIVKPAPVYPEAMAARGIEGYVRLKYTVTKNGGTDDIVVVSSSDKAFEKSAINAATRFKFKPRIVDGKAVAVTNVYNLIEFKLSGQ